MDFSLAFSCVLLTVCWSQVTGSSDHVTSVPADRKLLADSVDISKQVSIWLTSPPPATVSRKFGCTGAIIGREHVLASASCISWFPAERIQVAMALGDVAASEQFAQVTEITVNAGVDLAVLRVDAEFFADTAVAALAQGQLATGDKCTASGWNVVNSAWEQHEVSYMTTQDCTVAYSSVGTAIKEGMACAKTAVGNTACAESLGWQLECNGELTGLFSWTHYTCQQPSVYSSIGDAVTWISEAKGDARRLQLSGVMLIVTTVATVMFAW